MARLQPGSRNPKLWNLRNDTYLEYLIDFAYNISSFLSIADPGRADSVLHGRGRNRTRVTHDGLQRDCLGMFQTVLNLGYIAIKEILWAHPRSWVMSAWEHVAVKLRDGPVQASGEMCRPARHVNSVRSNTSLARARKFFRSLYCCWRLNLAAQ